MSKQAVSASTAAGFDDEGCLLSLEDGHCVRADADSRPRDAWRVIVDELKVGVLMLAEDWRVAYANRAAAAMLSSDAALTVEFGRLVIRPTTAAERCRVWLAGSGAPRKVIAVARASGRPPVLFEHLSTLTGGTKEPLHLLAMLDAGQPPRVDADRLEVAFDLTRAEARLVSALTDGRTLQMIAQQQGVTMSTVRTHLESVYAKTGARRQAQVVRLATACAAAFAMGSRHQAGEASPAGLNH